MDHGTRVHTPSPPPEAIEADDATRMKPQASAAHTPTDEATRIYPKAARKPSQAAPSASTTQIQPQQASARPKTAEIKTGSIIKQRFALSKKIGQGGMGVVYSARDLRKEELGDYDSAIAIKFLSQDFKRHPDSLKSLQQESAKAQSLAHPNIATVYDFDRDGGQVYMTMELLTGQPLSKITRKQDGTPLDTQAAIKIIQGIVQALSYAHEKGIIHSDLKPGNVFITEQGTAKLLDFGIARAAGSRHSPEPPAQAPQAQTPHPKHTSFDPGTLGAITPAYASPEMIAGLLPDPRDDIYALAIIAYELLAGKHPFKRLPADQAKAQSLKPKRIEGLKEPQWQGLLQGLAFEKEHRTESSEAFLQPFLPKRKERWKIVALALSLITAGILSYYQLNPPFTPDDIFDHPPPPVAWETLAEPVRSQITDKLELAEMHAEVNRLIAPPGGSALDAYNAILKIHPYDRRAIAGLTALYAQLTQLAADYLDNGYPEKAAHIIHVALTFHPHHQALLALQAKLPANLINKVDQP